MPGGRSTTLDRPHQSLGMAFPASRFTPAVSPLPLRVPSQLIAASYSAGLSSLSRPLLRCLDIACWTASQAAAGGGGSWTGWYRRQATCQVWRAAGLARPGAVSDRKVTIWVD